MGVVAPNDISWSSSSGIDLFIEVYDWDRLVLNGTGQVELSWQINLCTGIYPCSLSIFGSGGSWVTLTEAGSISCLASAGCTGLALSSVRFSCDQKRFPQSVLQVDSTKLVIYNTTFRECTSLSDGAIVQSFGNSSVSIASSEFRDVQSYGSGGAVSAYGGVVQISRSLFVNSSSGRSGGAISASAYSCVGSRRIVDTVFYVDGCEFDGCVSGGQGGAVSISGLSVRGFVNASAFHSCESATTGGALSASDGANLTVTDTILVNNSAGGLGGGALHSSDAELLVQGIGGEGNRALSGGGGVLYWSGSFEPTIVLWCSEGWIANFTLQSGPKCTECRAGSYQTGRGMTQCTSCAAGAYSSVTGATSAEACLPCKAGKYSTALMSTSSLPCFSCAPGSYSGAGSSTCALCAVGSYSSADGATDVSACMNCNAGSYSSSSGVSTGSACVLCDAGQFSASGAGNCTECRAGTYSTAIGAVSPQACLQCAQGKYSSASGASSSTLCASCPANTYSTRKYFTFELEVKSWLDAEASCAALGGHLASIESEEENTEVMNLVKYYHDYWIGYFFNATAGAWQWADGSTANFTFWAEANPKIGSDVFGCADLPAYPYTTENTSGLLAFWPYFSENYAIYPDAGPYSAPAAAWYNYDCGNGFDWVVGYVCSFAGSTACRECDAGKYSTAIGASSPDTCIPCPAHKTLDSSQDSACSNYTVSNIFPKNSNTRRRSTSFLEANERFALLRFENISFAFLKRQRRRKGRSRRSGAVVNLERSAQLGPQGSAPQTSQPLPGNEDSKHIDMSQTQRYSLSLDVIAGPRLQYEAGRESELFGSEGSVKRHLLSGDSTLPSYRKIGSVFPAFPTNNNCGIENGAAYGPCFASSYTRLEVSQGPTASDPAYPGISFTLTVRKLDSYNQQIGTDSSSVIQAQCAANCSISGNAVATLRGGQAGISVTIRPSFVVSRSSRIQVLGCLPFIYLKGIDSQDDRLSTMVSNMFPLLMSTAVCPPGYILLLDRSQSGGEPGASTAAGSCSQCQPGTYSVDPLVGINPQVPSCFNCPASGSCKGGSAVQFSLGTWKVIDGIYRLVGCPVGNQLVNSINGIFAHDIQNCLRCASDSYVVDSNNSNYTCQKCPIGAKCDGSALTSAVQGAVWAIDLVQGVYVLMSCPSGYEILAPSQEGQQCSLCPASSYCLGGASRRNSCPGDTFAPPGSNSSGACFAASLVSVSLLLPLTSDEFAASAKAFQDAVAAAAEVAAEYVVISGVSSGHRRSISTEIQVAMMKTKTICGHPFPPPSRAFSAFELSHSICCAINRLLLCFTTKRLVLAHLTLGWRTGPKVLVLTCNVVQVDVKVAASTAASAASLIGRLGSDALNTQLLARGLPAVSSSRPPPARPRHLTRVRLPRRRRLSPSAFRIRAPRPPRASGCPTWPAAPSGASSSLRSCSCSASSPRGSSWCRLPTGPSLRRSARPRPETRPRRTSCPRSCISCTWRRRSWGRGPSAAWSGPRPSGGGSPSR